MKTETPKLLFIYWKVRWERAFLQYQMPSIMPAILLVSLALLYLVQLLLIAFTWLSTSIMSYVNGKKYVFFFNSLLFGFRLDYVIAFIYKCRNIFILMMILINEGKKPYNILTILFSILSVFFFLLLCHKL